MGRNARIGTAYAIGVALGLVVAFAAGLFEPRTAAPSTGAGTARTLGRAPDDDLAADAFGCEIGDGAACLRAAHALGHTHEGDHDVVTIAKLLARACARAVGEACDELGNATHSGDGVLQSSPRAVALFDRACKLGVARGCTHLSWLQRTGDGVAMSIADAQVADERACELGDAAACDTLGMELRDGTQRPRDVARGLATMAKACDRDAMHCYHLAATYFNGTSVPGDHPRAAQLFRRGCDAGDPAACNTLGEMWVAEPSLPGRGDPRATLELFQRACDGGIGTGCINVSLERGNDGSGSGLE